MVYFTLRGGLANMMFQIAAVKAIAMSKNTEASFQNLDSQLRYLNNESNFNPNLKHCEEYMRLGFFSNIITGKTDKELKVITYPFHYQEMVLPDGDFILDGFFQSEKYFKKYEKEIREFFKPTESILTEINGKYNHLFNQRTTSIHIRRGDYVRNSQHHPILSLEYYQKAIELTKDNTDRYIIFSDDIDWCKKHFTGDGIVFIENEKDYIEIYLMSMCDNNIIANSSFSWWGAWLNNNPDKTVVGPLRWFGPAYTHINTNDILPEGWYKI